VLHLLNKETTGSIKTRERPNATGSTSKHGTLARVKSTTEGADFLASTKSKVSLLSHLQSEIKELRRKITLRKITRMFYKCNNIKNLVFSRMLQAIKTRTKGRGREIMSKQRVLRWD
jgi:hypothetical protein